jgi:hypothetical protein
VKKIALLIILFSFSCTNTENKSHQENFKEIIVQDSTALPLKGVVLANAPLWFSPNKINEKQIVANAYGISSRRSLSVEKALLSAQSLLAGKLQKRKLTGGVKRENTSIDISGFTIKHQKTIHKGDKWISYIALSLEKN